jgi:hypothetical protein
VIKYILNTKRTPHTKKPLYTIRKVKIMAIKKQQDKKDKADELPSKLDEVSKSISEKINSLETMRGNCICFPLLMGGVSISSSMVDDIYDELLVKCPNTGRLDVLVESGGGDLNAAYSLANLFRKFGQKELNFIVPRWAKSAATLLVCSGDRIFMTPVAELGPLDPQITQFNPLEKHLEKFSPLHIEATLELIRNEFSNGNEKLAHGLMERLQFPITLGSFTKSLDIAVQYLTKLLSTRMLKGNENAELIKSISRQLTTCYSDHGFSINIDEAKTIGLKIEELPTDQLKLVWEIHKLNVEKRKIEKKIKDQKMAEMMKNIPKELLESIPQEILDQITEKENSEKEKHDDKME